MVNRLHDPSLAHRRCQAPPNPRRARVSDCQHRDLARWHTSSIAGGNEREVGLWRISNEKLLQKLKGHTNSISSVAFSPDGVTLASGSQDNTVRLWDYQKKELLRQLSEHTNIVNTVSFSPDGELFASGSSDYSVRLWRVSDGKFRRKLVANSLQWVSCVAFSPDGQTLAASSWTLVTPPRYGCGEYRMENYCGR